MSVDLSRPLVPSMGHHDPLDGFVTAIQLRTTAAALGSLSDGPDLDAEIAEFAKLVGGRDWTTDDALGIGGVLMDACRVGQLVAGGWSSGRDLLVDLLTAAGDGLERWVQQGELHRPATHRLAFRELGLAIGLSGLDRLSEIPSVVPPAPLKRLLDYRPVGTAITSCWRDVRLRPVPGWTAHRDINEVMLASCLVPEGVLGIVSAR
jgi:hypothetical protein